MPSGFWKKVTTDHRKHNDMNRTDFPILNETIYGKPLVYLDNAATTQKPQQVLDTMVEAYSRYNANIHRGVHHLSQVATERHEAARQRVADFIGASRKEPRTA